MEPDETKRLEEAAARMEEIMDKGQHMEDLKEGDPLFSVCTSSSLKFTQIVDHLRCAPRRPLAELGALFWDLVGHKVILLAMGLPVKTVSFVAVRSKATGMYRGQILLPSDWPERVVANPVMQVGAVVHTASQGRDLYNGRLSQVDTPKRALAYESEFLHLVRNDVPEMEFSDYQKAVLTNYPKGIETPGVAELMYESKPFFLAES